jgi:hypothetical protein
VAAAAQPSHFVSRDGRRMQLLLDVAGATAALST